MDSLALTKGKNSACHHLKRLEITIYVSIVSKIPIIIIIIVCQEISGSSSIHGESPLVAWQLLQVQKRVGQIKL